MIEAADGQLKSKKSFFLRDDFVDVEASNETKNLIQIIGGQGDQDSNSSHISQSTTQMKSFLGPSNVYRCFIKYYIKVSVPIT